MIFWDGLGFNDGRNLEVNGYGGCHRRDVERRGRSACGRETKLGFISFNKLYCGLYSLSHSSKGGCSLTIEQYFHADGGCSLACSTHSGSFKQAQPVVSDLGGIVNG